MAELEEKTDVDLEEEQELSDEEAADAAVEDSEGKTYTQEEFGGLLRDKQAAETARQNAQAADAAKAEIIEQQRQQIEELQKPKDALSDEDAEMPVTKGELKTFGKDLASGIIEAVKSESKKDKATNLAKQQADDARNLMKTHTVKANGQGLDAKTVVNEGTAYLQLHHPDLFEAARKSPNFASEVYRLCLTFVPEIRKRHLTRQNALLAKKLDESGAAPPSGSGTGAGGEEGVLFSILDGSMPEGELDKLMGRT